MEKRLILEKDLSSFFYSIVPENICETNAKTYIISIFSKKDITLLSNESITLIYKKAKENNQFSQYQNIADYLLFSFCIFPQHLNSASEDYYQSIAKLSYYKCYQLVKKQWLLFEELSDNFEQITLKIYNKIKDLEEQTLPILIFQHSQQKLLY